MSDQRLLARVERILSLFPESSIPETRQVKKYRTPGYGIINDRIKAKLAKRTHEHLRASLESSGQLNLFTGTVEGEER